VHCSLFEVSSTTSGVVLYFLLYGNAAHWLADFRHSRK